MGRISEQCADCVVAPRRVASVRRFALASRPLVLRVHVRFSALIRPPATLALPPGVPLNLSILTLTLWQPMHTLLLERADDGLDGLELLLVLLDPVRSAGGSPQINLFEQISLLTLELRQEVGSGDMVVAGEAGDLGEHALHLQWLETKARFNPSRVKVGAGIGQLQRVSGDELVRIDWLRSCGRNVYRSTCHRLFPLFAHGVFAHPRVHERHLGLRCSSHCCT